MKGALHLWQLSQCQPVNGFFFLPHLVTHQDSATHESDSHSQQRSELRLLWKPQALFKCWALGIWVCSSLCPACRQLSFYPFNYNSFPIQQVVGLVASCRCWFMSAVSLCFIVFWLVKHQWSSNIFACSVFPTKTFSNLRFSQIEWFSQLRLFFGGKSLVQALFFQVRVNRRDSSCFVIEYLTQKNEITQSTALWNLSLFMGTLGEMGRNT